MFGHNEMSFQSLHEKYNFLQVPKILVRFHSIKSFENFLGQYSIKKCMTYLSKKRKMFITDYWQIRASLEKKSFPFHNNLFLFHLEWKEQSGRRECKGQTQEVLNFKLVFCFVSFLVLQLRSYYERRLKNILLTEDTFSFWLKIFFQTQYKLSIEARDHSF